MPIELKDKIAISVSIVALVISIATPIATFYWLDPKVKESHDKQIVYEFRDRSQHMHLRFRKSDRDDTTFYHIAFTVRLENIGVLPVNNVVVAIRPAIPKGTSITFNPPVPFSEKTDSNSSFINLEHALGRNELLDLQVAASIPTNEGGRLFTSREEEEKEVEQQESCGEFIVVGDPGCDDPPLVWVSSEVGPATSVPFFRTKRTPKNRE